MKTKKLMGEYLEILDAYLKVKEQRGGLSGSVKNLEELGLLINSFWLSEYDSVSKDLENIDDLKLFYWGDFPHFKENFVKRMSLYSDFLIINDPFLKILYNPFGSHDEEKLRKLRAETVVQSYYHINKLRDWIEEGIVILFPEYHPCERFHRDIAQMAIDDAKKAEFEFTPTKNDIALFNVFIQCYKEGVNPSSVAYTAMVNWTLRTCSSLRSFPITDVSLQWRNLNLKAKLDGRKIFGDDVIASAALASANIKFLDNVTLDFAKKVREEGYLSDLRVFFRESFKEIATTPDSTEFLDLVNNYSVEIIDKVNKHEKEYKQVKEEAQKTIGVKGSLALAGGALTGAATFGLTIPSWMGVMGAVIGGYGIKDVVNEILKYKKERNIHRNELHLLYELKQMPPK